MTEKTIDVNVISSKLAASGNDFEALNEAERKAYYIARCEAAGLDPLSVPFQMVKLQGKLVFYATKGCTDQLTAAHRISCEMLSQEVVTGMIVTKCRAIIKSTGQSMDDIGVVPTTTLQRKDAKGNWLPQPKVVDLLNDPLQAEGLANAFMKSWTKARRRAILSVCGMAMTDESELETIPGAQKVHENYAPVETKAEPAKEETPKPTVQSEEDVVAQMYREVDPEVAAPAAKPERKKKTPAEKAEALVKDLKDITLADAPAPSPAPAEVAKKIEESTGEIVLEEEVCPRNPAHGKMKFYPAGYRMTKEGKPTPALLKCETAGCGGWHHVG